MKSGHEIMCVGPSLKKFQERINAQFARVNECFTALNELKAKYKNVKKEVSDETISI